VKWNISRITNFRGWGIEDWFFSKSQQIRDLLHKLYFSSEENIYVSFGLNRKFEFDSRCPRPPQLNGTVIASVSCNREEKIRIYFYPISQDLYPQNAKNEFHNEVLPSIKEWVHNQTSKPETAVLGVEQFLIEWNGETHLTHQLNFL
jgi:hypothetical protein